MSMVPNATSSGDEEETMGEILQKEKPSYEHGNALTHSGRYGRFTSGSERPPKSTSTRKKKSRPREISSRRPVPVGRERCLGIDSGVEHSRSVKKFDPRFEEHCGELREGHIERNYAFIQSLRASERKQLENAVKANPIDEEALGKLRSMEQDEVRRRAIERRRDIMKNFRKEEKEAVKRGKQPYFLKEKDIRKLEVKAKFDDLKKKGGIKKYIQKRRKRLTGKDRKLLPNRRPGPSTAPPDS
ncbi:Ribosomal RNA processing protein 36-like [Gracilariopsis chorda]|uniref:rRNA biogenesis protein RRP36 n=1 Tax=Gracilariopsis chorda TaxID=448386 RepID=A0A2V3J5X5_9FLOR|nr:Ribosomal RNA processing protein 36-like [Gracilariopsis chorda]|eukprot:PXF49828.1 Ribosomal RNA processing protein 36-like [Gracilariopsis chorda]